MASRRDYSGTLGWKDVAGNIVAFEAINGVRVELRLSTADHHGRADLVMTAIAHDRKSELGEAPPLASASLSCSGSNARSLDVAIIALLYTLDGQLAEGEFARTLSS